MQTLNDINNVSKISNEELLTNLEKLVRSERKITELILKHILEVEMRKLHLSLGYESVYKYLTKHLGYSESAAYDRLQAARLLKSVPSLGTKLQEGKINLTQLVKVEQSLKQEKRLGYQIDPAKAIEVLAKLENKNTFESEKILALEFNHAPKTTQKIKPQQDHSVRMELTLTKEQYELLQKAQNLLSHIVVDNNLADAITYLAKNFIQKKEGKSISDKTETKKQNKPKEKQVTRKSGTTKSPTRGFRVMPRVKRQYLPLKTRREVFAKAQNCCEYVDLKTKRRCSSRYQLQIDHHLKPVALGGGNEITNLRLLCGAHNRAEALRWGLGWRQ